MDAEDARSLGDDRNLLHRRDELVLRRRDQGGQVAGDAGLEQHLAGAAIALRVRFEEVDAAEAVDLQVDEAGHGEAAAVRRRDSDARDAAVDDLDVSRKEPAADQRRFDAELHGRSAVLMFPPAAASRERAVSTSRPPSSITIATFALPSAAASASSTACWVAPVAVITI